jgi:hypothetical protein
MSDQKTVLRQLRPPYAGIARVIYGFQRNAPQNFGYTLAIPVGAEIVAPGDGTVDLVRVLPVRWRYTQAPLKGGSTVIRIDHGYGVKTWLHGFGTTRPSLGRVTRGTVLGTCAHGEMFLAIEIYGSMANPGRVNTFFAPRNGFLFSGQATALRPAPNVATQFVSTLAQLIQSGIRYFSPQTFLVNVDFNGDGTKVGAAAAGVGTDDVWNVAAPLASAFQQTAYNYYCGPLSYNYNVNPTVDLRDYRGKASSVKLRRVAEDSFYGSSSEFDPMLSTYIGGYSGMTPRETTFDIRGLPPGPVTVYAYANQESGGNATTFSLSVNGGSPQVLVNLTTATDGWVENYNYVKFQTTLGVNSYLTLQALGFISGLQITR